MNKKHNFSEAEHRFREYMHREHPDFKITKKGLPDFMLIKNQRVVGFVEVKRNDLRDILRKEQIMFRNFCKENGIPYQAWSPIMALERWKDYKKSTMNEKTHRLFKRRMMYVDRSIFEQLEPINKKSPITKNNTKFYTAEELAKELRVNVMTVYRYIKAGKLKAYKMSKEFRIEKKEFQRFLNKIKTK